MNAKLLRKLPKVDELLAEEKIAAASCGMPREQAVDAIRATLESIREEIISAGDEADEASVSREAVTERAAAAVRSSGIRSLRRVINGTGVVLHTNLGRAKLSAAAMSAAAEVADKYSTLEYDAQKGERGSRHSHVENIIKKITGCEAAMVVNNNAAATMLCLAALCRGREVIISRGELVEIGGSFRVPEIMEESGAHLVEVGTTNKTKAADYAARICEETAALMKVHTSNYKIIGFTQEVGLRELAELGHEAGLPVIYDLGSGLMTDLSAYGIDEPTVKAALRDGADVVLFSGDKLLGGPQGGIIIGRKDLIEKMKAHPLARIVRVDKITIAAMEATFREYYSESGALKNIPVLAMLTAGSEELRLKADRLKELIGEKAPQFTAAVEETENMAGGGSAPQTVLAGWGVTLARKEMTPAQIEKKLREGQPPVVARIAHDKLILDVRTMTEEELETAAGVISHIEP